MSDSYDHMLVSKLFSSKADTRHMLPKDHPKAAYYFIDDVPVMPPLWEFCKAIRKVVPGIKFHANPNDHAVRTVDIPGTEEGRSNLYKEVSAYYPSEDYTLAVLAFTDTLSVTDSAGDQFVVCSRKINNARYKAGTEHRHRLFTGNLTKAVKNALPNLMPYTVEEMAEAAGPGLSTNIYRLKNDADSALSNIVNPLQNRVVLVQEFINLIEQGAKFVTPAFTQAALEVIAAQKKAKELKARKFNAYYVYVRVVGSEQRFEVVEYTGLDMNYTRKKVGARLSVLADAVPEDIMGKVAALMMMDIDHYVPEVGKRVSEKSFWVERDA